MIVGITGNFGTGKTTVANIFGRYGFDVINVDRLYHNIYKKNPILISKLRKEFGTAKRNEIRKIVFNNSEKLNKLNFIVHPIIIKAIKNQAASITKKKNNAKIIIDIPLLFEAKLEKMFD